MYRRTAPLAQDPWPAPPQRRASLFHRGAPLFVAESRPTKTFDEGTKDGACCAASTDGLPSPQRPAAAKCPAKQTARNTPTAQTEAALGAPELNKRPFIRRASTRCVHISAVPRACARSSLDSGTDANERLGARGGGIKAQKLTHFVMSARGGLKWTGPVRHLPSTPCIPASARRREHKRAGAKGYNAAQFR